MHNVVRDHGGMDIEHVAASHEQRAEDVRAYLAHDLKDLIDDLKAEIKFDKTAGMLTALIQAYRELGRLYQVAEKPGGKGLSEVQAARMVAEAEARGRLAVLEELASERRKALESATSNVRESLIALSDKSLG